MADATTAEVTCVLDARAELGECPVWSAEEEALYWVDIRAPALHRLDPGTGATRTWPVPGRVGPVGVGGAGGGGGGRARRGGPGGRPPSAGPRHRGVAVRGRARPGPRDAVQRRQGLPGRAVL